MEIQVDETRTKGLMLFEEWARGTYSGEVFTVNMSVPPGLLFLDFEDERYELRMEYFIDAVIDDREKKQKEILVVSR